MILGFSFTFQSETQKILVWKLHVCWLGSTTGPHHMLRQWIWLLPWRTPNRQYKSFLLGWSDFLKQNFPISCLKGRAGLLLFSEAVGNEQDSHHEHVEFTRTHVFQHAPYFALSCDLPSVLSGGLASLLQRLRSRGLTVVEKGHWASACFL